MSPTDWTSGEDRRMADARGEGPDTPPAPITRLTTEELLRLAAYWRLFQTPEDEARADSDDEEARS